MKYWKKFVSVLLAGVLAVGMTVLSGCQKSESGNVGYQLNPPEAGEEIAVLTTN